MKISRLIEQLQEILDHGGDDVDVHAWDPDLEDHAPVTGIVYGPERATLHTESNDEDYV